MTICSKKTLGDYGHHIATGPPKRTKENSFIINRKINKIKQKIFAKKKKKKKKEWSYKRSRKEREREKETPYHDSQFCVWLFYSLS